MRNMKFFTLLHYAAHSMRQPKAGDKHYEGLFRKHLQRRRHESVVTGRHALAPVPNPAPKRRDKNMYAIVEIAGKQFSVREKDRLIVPHLEGNANDSVTFDRVLLIAGSDGVRIGAPVVPDASVKATILEHVKGDKIVVFRKKRRKRFKVKRGHRQPYTRIEIGSLSPGGEKEKKTAAKKTAGTVKEAGTAAKKTASKAKEAGTAAKKTAGKVKEAGTAAKKTAGKAKEAGTAAKKTAGTVKEAGTTAKKTAGKVKEAGTAAKKTAGKVKEAGTAAKKTAGKAKEAGTTAKTARKKPTPEPTGEAMHPENEAAS